MHRCIVYRCLVKLSPTEGMPIILVFSQDGCSARIPRLTMMNKDESVKALITDPVLQQRLAKYLVLKCFRNSVLEDLHAGIIPDSKSGGFSDVVVRTPFGEIP